MIEQAMETLVQTTPTVLDFPVASLQIVQEVDVLDLDWLERSDVAPTLEKNADGLWILHTRRQGTYGMFEVSYIHSEVLLADAEMGLIVVLVSYHGVTAYGRRGNKHVQKAQFYRYYQQQSCGDWQQVLWRELSDETRKLVLALPKPEWARLPGKLRSEYKPPSGKVVTTSYKVVRLIDGRYFSLYDPTVEYVLGQRVKQPAKPGHGGGFYSYPTLEMGTDFLAGCAGNIPFHSDIATPHVALLECEIGGRIVNYGHKMASTYLCPLRVLGIEQVRSN